MAPLSEEAEEYRHVSFVVKCSTTAVGEHLRVVGAEKQFGRWVPEKSSVVLHTTANDFPVWRSGWVALDAGDSQYEYKYVICGKGYSRWEQRVSRHLEFTRDCRIEIEEAFDSSHVVKSIQEVPAALRIKDTGSIATFVTRCGWTRVGEHLRVVGSIEALGNWTPELSSVKLSTGTGEFPVWRSGKVALPPGPCRFEYKYVILGEGGRVFWEDRANRRLQLGNAEEGKSFTVFDDFGSPAEGRCTEDLATDSPTHCEEELGAVAEEDSNYEEDSYNEEWQWKGSPHQSASSQLEEEEVADLEKSCSRVPPVLRKKMEKCASVAAVFQYGSQRTPSTATPNSTSRTLRRRKTISCLKELDEGLLPTTRLLGAEFFDVNSLVREANRKHIERCRNNKETPQIKEMEEQQHDPTMSGIAKSPASTSGPSGDGSTGGSPGDSPTSGGLGEVQGEEDEEDSLDPDEPAAGRQPKISWTRSVSQETALEASATWEFKDGYEIHEKLGEGAFGIVYRATDRYSHAVCAVKVVEKRRFSAPELMRILGGNGNEGEVHLHKSLSQHDHIVFLWGFYEDSKAVRLVMDLCCGGDIFDEINRVKLLNKQRHGSDLALAPAAAALVTRQVLSGLTFCHENGVVHRDIKAENILLARSSSEVPLDSNDAVVKIADFGLSARCRPQDGLLLKDACGSPDYVAPEVLCNEPYGPKVDVWSAGVLLFACLRGRMPFPAKTDREALMLVRNGQYVFDDSWSQIESQARACVEHLLQKSATSRPSAAEAAAHSWLQAAEEPLR